MIIYTDYFATIQIARQTTLSTSSTDKLNLHLIRVSQYLLEFNLIIRYKIDKINVVLDALSRLQVDVAIKKKQVVLKSLYNSLVTLNKRIAPLEVLLIYHITLIEISDNFKKRLVEAYNKNSQ